MYHLIYLKRYGRNCGYKCIQKYLRKDKTLLYYFLPLKTGFMLKTRKRSHFDLLRFVSKSVEIMATNKIYSEI
jgi:hypothetical protein